MLFVNRVAESFDVILSDTITAVTRSSRVLSLVCSLIWRSLHDFSGGCIDPGLTSLPN